MELSIHNVKEVEVKEINSHERKDDTRFYVRHLLVWDDKGNKFELTLFSDERRSLELTGEGA